MSSTTTSKVPGCFDHEVDGVLAVFNHDNLVTLGFKVETQPAREMHFVFDNQYLAQATILGRRMVMVAPFPSPALAAEASPPWRRAMLLTRKSPRPVPLMFMAERRGTR